VNDDVDWNNETWGDNSNDDDNGWSDDDNNASGWDLPPIIY